MIDTPDEPSKSSFKLLWISIALLVVITLAVTLFRSRTPDTRLIILDKVVKAIRSEPSVSDRDLVKKQMIVDADSIPMKGIKTQRQYADRAYRAALDTAKKWVRKNSTFKNMREEYQKSSPSEWIKLESNLDDLCGELFSETLTEVAERSKLKRFGAPLLESKPIKNLVKPQTRAPKFPKPPTNPRPRKPEERRPLSFKSEFNQN
jgi:hypothetical protein